MHRDAPCDHPPLVTEVFRKAGLSTVQESSNAIIGHDCANLIAAVNAVESNDVKIIKLKKDNMSCHLVWVTDKYLHDPQSQVMLKGKEICDFYDGHYKFFDLITITKSHELHLELDAIMVHDDSITVLSD